MKAFIFGTFNPVTNAHINMGVVARDFLSYKLGQKYEIVYVPTNDEYIRGWKEYKNGSVLSADIRVGLLRDAVSEYGFTVTDAEIAGLTSGKTYDTIKHFGFDNSVLCLGLDNVVQMTKWYRWQELAQNCKLLIFRRKLPAADYLNSAAAIDKVLKCSYDYRIVDLYMEQADISSTEVRKCYINGDTDRLKSLVPANVYQYLEENENVYF